MSHTPPRFESPGTEHVWIYNSGHPGKTAVILGGVHGDEQAGPKTIRVVMDEVEAGKIPVEKGRLIVIEGNPRAVEKGKRATSDKDNLNRDFKPLTPAQQANASLLSYEQNRAQELLPYLDMADTSLDLHEHHQSGGVPFIIGESMAFATARAIGAPYVASGFSRTEPGGTDGYMAAQGKPGICFELGYYKDTEENIQRGLQAVKRYLGHNGLIKTAGVPPLYSGEPIFVRADAAITRKDEEFSFLRHYDSFTELRPGEIVAEDGDKWYQAQKGDLIIFPNPNVGLGKEAFNIAHVIHPKD